MDSEVLPAAKWGKLNFTFASAKTSLVRNTNFTARIYLRSKCRATSPTKKDRVKSFLFSLWLGLFLFYFYSFARQTYRVRKHISSTRCISIDAVEYRRVVPSTEQRHFYVALSSSGCSRMLEIIFSISSRGIVSEHCS